MATSGRRQGDSSAKSGRHQGDIRATSARQFSATSGRHQGDIRATSARHQGDVRATSGRHQGDARATSARNQHNARATSGDISATSAKATSGRHQREMSTVQGRTTTTGSSVTVAIQMYSLWLQVASTRSSLDPHRIPGTLSKHYSLQTLSRPLLYKSANSPDSHSDMPQNVTKYTTAHAHNKTTPTNGQPFQHVIR